MVLHTPKTNLPYVQPADTPITYPTTSQELATKLDALLGSLTGVVVPYAGSAAPSGWLLCDGSAVSRTTYAALFAVCGTTYGIGDGSATFNLPNLKGQAPFGRDAAQSEFAAIGTAGGVKAHAHALGASGQAQIQMSGTAIYISRTVAASWTPGNSNTFAASLSGAGPAQVQAAGLMGTTNNTTGTNGLPPYLTLNFIICT